MPGRNVNRLYNVREEWVDSRLQYHRLDGPALI
jgi:hypothetical protein